MPLRAHSLPLGVDLGTHRVSIVVPSTVRGEFIVRETQTREIPAVALDRRDTSTAETIRDVLAKLLTRERRCILAAPAATTIVKAFRIPPRMRRSEAERAAALEADALVDWPTSERVVALDPIPGTPDRMLLSVARAGTIERLISVARAGGLKPVAVDIAVCALRRAIPDADAVLDCTDERAELMIFGDPVGVTHQFPPRLVDERLAAQVRAAFVEARRDGVADVQRLVILATRFRYEALEDRLRDDGHSVAPVVLGQTEAPAWTLAYGLASWSIAFRGLCG